ncbi:MAG TPA: hypothetical protein VMW68_04475 [Methyloceanibacter sp.]|nr:hypothetical protein [Methyloceanibacter sp.]
MRTKAPTTILLPRLYFAKQPTPGRNAAIDGTVWDVQLVNTPTLAARVWGTKGALREYLLIVGQETRPAPVQAAA